MNELTRKRVLRYGIAIDLVIVATGIGMLYPSPWLIAMMFFAATAASDWKGGWRGGLLALGLSLLMMFAAFPGELRTVHVVVYALSSAAMLALVWMTSRGSVPATAQREVSVSAPALAPALAPVAPIDTFRAAAETARSAKEAKDAEAARADEAARLVNEEKKKRAAAEKKAEDERRERARMEKELAQREARAREERERVEAERTRAEAERARLAKELAEREEREREMKEQLEATLRARLEEERAQEREQERVTRQRAEEERQRAEAERERVEAERARLAQELAERDARERETKELLEAATRERERALQERLEGERRAEAERLVAAERERLAQELAARDARERELEERLEAERKAAEERIALLQKEALQKEALRKEAEMNASRAAAPLTAPAASAMPPAPFVERRKAPRPPAQAPASLFDKVAEWFGAGGDRRTVNMVNRRVTNNVARKPPVRSVAQRPTASHTRKPRLLLVERRRGTADTAVAKMRQRGVEIDVVERWVDAVDEMFRFKPDALFLDVDHPEFDLIHRTITDQNPKLPLVFTGSTSSTPPPAARTAPWVVRPYNLDELARVAQQAMTHPAELAARTASAAPTVVSAPKPVEGAVVAEPEPVQRNATNEYEVDCFTCRIAFNAIDADWCSCLTRERTLVCTNCLTCFCKASAAYKEKFWIAAPPRLFERKNSEAQRQVDSLPANAPASRVKRPLVLCVDDDAQIQAIVAKICEKLGYGFICAGDGQAGLTLARDYKPNLILSDAFMPKLDGREMCRILKEEPLGETCRMVVMTGLYTDTKYRSEAVKRFHIDDYIAKPVAVTDLINLLQKHLEGVSGLPVQMSDSDADFPMDDAEPEVEETAQGAADDVPLADVLSGTFPRVTPDSATLPIHAHEAHASDGYEVCCFNCQNVFDATNAEWCSCVGRDNTLVCPKCNGCFCKAPASYKERFWIDAPPSLFERKMIGSKRHLNARANPAPPDVKRPLILLVEDDENVQLIVRTVVTNMGYGFVVGANGQEGLLLAREYEPELILSDAFMPKLDGREMCRLLKEDPRTSQSKAIIMTGLYTDRKYRNEALSYFKVDDYVAKPLAVDDLIKLFKKHLPQQVSAVN